ncbi:MAG: hypothetical protein IT184_05140 [Acidobacteria bacterium]|nr:hypothetical protein [Acidobacteriota bacterium]
MHSALASDIARMDRERMLALTPAERVELAMRLSAEGLAAYMAAHEVDLRTARAAIAATRRAGRPRSRSAEG